MLHSMQNARGQVQHADRAREKHVDKNNMLHISCEMHVDNTTCRAQQQHVKCMDKYNMPHISCEMQVDKKYAANRVKCMWTNTTRYT